MSSDEQKKRAAVRALEFIEAGMIVGLGTGSTAEHFVRALAARVAEGLSITTVATSERTAEMARACGIEVQNLNDVSHVHVTVDGADEVDRALRLIKGGGGALLREKIVAAASDRMVVIVDAGKVVETLGRFALPVEVIPFGLPHTLRKIEGALMAEGCPGHGISVRKDKKGAPFVTDGGHYIVDCACETIPKPEALAAALQAIPGVVDHGLFIRLASCVIVGREDRTDILERPEAL